MPIPGQTLTVNENGLGTVEPATNIPLYMGYSTLGVANVLKTYNSINALVAEQGQGAAVEAATYDLANAGGPIRFMKLATSVSGSAGAPSNAGGGPAVTLAGTPSEDFQGVIRVRGGGVLGVGTFDYTLDNGKTFSEVQVIPAGGAFAIPNTGLTATFAAGTYIASATYTWNSTAPMWNSTDLAAAFTALQSDPTEFDFTVCVGRHASGAAAAVSGAALMTQLTILANQFRFVRGMIDAGDEATAAIISAWGSVVANRVLPAYRSMVVSSAKPYPGWSTPKQRVLNAMGMRAHQSAISSDLGRVKSGPIPNVFSIEHDEFLTEVMDAQKISTMRTYRKLPGFYITNGRLKAASGSDFQYWQYGRLMDVACATVYEKQALWINAGVRTNPDGTIYEADAQAIETDVYSALSARLLQPRNAEGTPGHVSNLIYTIDRSVNIQTTSTVLADLAIQPLGYAKFFNTTLGFVAQLATPQAA